MSNVFDLEDIITYCKCPLRLRYKKWGAEEKVVDAREAICIASKNAIRAYLSQGTNKIASPSLALDKATKVFKKTLVEYDQLGLFSGDINWAVHLNFGLVMIRRFHEKINHLVDRPILGPVSCSYPIGDDVVVGDLDGFIAFSVESRQELRFGVVTISQRPSSRSAWERIREGFAYGSFRQLTEGLKTSPVSIVNVDPWSRKIEEYSVGPEDKYEFETLAGAAIQGMRHGIYVPQPIKANCRTCPYDRSCQIKYARYGEVPWHKKEFLSSVEQLRS
jgi:hypothetical protein